MIRLRHVWTTDASASTPTTTGRLALFRPAVAAATAALALDAHDRENQDGCRALVGSAMHGDPETPRPRIRREFDDGRHFLSLTVDRSRSAHDLIKIRTW